MGQPGEGKEFSNFSWFSMMFGAGLGVGLMVFATALASFPITVFLQMTIPLFIGQSVSFGFWEQFSFTLPITVIFGVMVNFAIGDVYSNDNGASVSDDNALLKRLPVGVRGPVKHMSMQDHYIQVTTTRGKELVLMRMADAVSALGVGHGLQVHRSHWVNKEFVSDARRENGQPVVVMDDGAEYPVSRSYVKAARKAGVI